MTSTKKIRQLLQVTQQQLADYLSVTRAQLAMAETGRRQLPTAALLKLSAIERSQAGSAALRGSKEMQKHLVQAGKKLLAQVRQYDALAAIETQKLDSLRSQEQECLKILQVTAALLAELPAVPASKKDRLWLELVESAALKKMETCGTGAQALLQLQADVFAYHARRARELML